MGSGWTWCHEPSRTGVGRTQPQGGRGASSSPWFWHVLVPTRPHWRPCRLPAPAAPAPTPSAGARLRPPCTGASLFLRGSEPGPPAALCSNSTQNPSPLHGFPTSAACSVGKRAWVPAQLPEALGGDGQEQGPGPVSTGPCTSRPRPPLIPHSGDSCCHQRLTCGSSAWAGRQGPRSGRASGQQPSGRMAPEVGGGVRRLLSPSSRVAPRSQCLARSLSGTKLDV